MGARSDNDVNDAISFPRVSGSRIMKRKPRLDRPLQLTVRVKSIINEVILVK